jgi:acylphosphatase
MAKVRAHLIINGRVQGVFFRESAATEARSLGVNGWIRNVADHVEAVYEGHRSAVERMVDWSHEGPARADVSGVETRWEEPEDLTRFVVIH